MLWPDLYQHDPGGLNEQTAQIAIAALRYAAEDRAVACRYLLRHQSKPGAEVAAFREHVSSADRGYHRARDDRADARDRHQSLAVAHAVQRLQVELVGGLGRDELHGRALDSLGDGFRITEVILLSLRIGAHVFRGHQSGVVAEHLELATEMMRADAGLHTD